MNSVHTQNAEIEFIFMSQPSIQFILFSVYSNQKKKAFPTTYFMLETSRSGLDLKLKFQYLRNLKALELL